MTPATDPDLLQTYLDAEQAYLRHLPLEHFMEATAEATQRAITVQSFDVLRAARPDVQLFSELVVQYPRPNQRRPGQVVPDNMVVVHPEPIEADGSFNTPFQPAGPFVVLEYVSRHNARKDYEGNMLKYERFLRVPYYLLFYPDNLELSLFRLVGDRFVTVLPNAAGRLPIPELELEVALLDEWMRYWFRGELLPLSGELLLELDAVRAEVAAERAARRAAEARASVAERRASVLEQELARLREELARARGEG